MKDKYPNIYKACFEVTLDNGGLNRDRSENQIEEEFDAWLLGVEENENWDLKAMDTWIGTLIKEDLEILTAGEETEMMELSALGPPHINDMLNAWFDGPC